MQVSIPFYTFTKVDEKLIAEIELLLEVEYREGENQSQYSPGEPSGVENAIVDMVKLHDVVDENGTSVSPELKYRVNELIQSNFVGQNIMNLPLVYDDGSPLDSRKLAASVEEKTNKQIQNGI